MDNGGSRSGRTAIALAGGAILAWFFLRGRGWRLGIGHNGSGGDAGTPRPPVGPPCRVHMDASGIELDGKRTDLATTLATCRAAGVAEVTATGAAIVGAIAEVLHALRAAGVIVLASPDLLDLAGLTDPTTGRP